MLAARTDRDFVAVSPEARRRAAGGSAAALRLARVVFTHPREVLAGLILAGASAAVTVNALGLQTGRHPAPLFSGAQRAFEAPLPPARPLAPPQAAPALPSGAAAPVPPARTVAAPPSAQADSTKSGRDSIGDLIRATEAPLRPPGNVGDAARVASAQRALAKLGYGSLKPDGVMGTGTRQAIERFEKDRGLPVTGELGARTARELAGQSRIALD